MRIGARMIKTALAVVLCMIIDSFLKQGSGFLSATAAIIAMQSTFQDSFSKGKTRILGTFFGALLGYLFALIDPGNILLIGIGIILLIYCFNYLNWDTGIVISCVVFLLIMEEQNNTDIFSYSINRLIDTTIGIVIALLVNYLVMPPKLLKNLYEECKNLFKDLSKDIDIILSNQATIDLEKYHEKIMELKKKADIPDLEITLQRENQKEIIKINEIIDDLFTIYEHLSFIQELKKSDCIFILPKIAEDNGVEEKQLPHIMMEFHKQQIQKKYRRLNSLLNAKSSKKILTKKEFQ
ncbi:FUSC family protein [Garciella nitratireducens]|uniref:FUSC family protein n=1 Tax=Garciella nitratireducens TaxID=218205 RepID=UPI001BD3725B|nr:aromatic acid exporter family protein [Garciella nitratireducens]